MFFLVSITEAADITGFDLECVFKQKMEENYDRIKKGYNNSPEERGGDNNG